jgi:polysaccharide biosynthesis transport protein
MSAARAPSAGPAETPGLIRAIDVLRERWWVVLVAAVTCVGISLVLTLRATKEYTATAKLRFGQNALMTEVGGTAPAPSPDPQADQATNLLLVTTTPLAAAVKQALRSPLSVSDLLGKVSTTNDQSSNIVDVSATDPSPVRAAQIANAFAGEYVAYSQSVNRQQVLAGEQLITQQLNALPPIPSNAANRANLEGALQKLVLVAAVQTGDAQVVDQASVPTSPSSPNRKVNLIVALVFGLALGVGLAFLLNLLDRRLKGVEDFEDLLGTRALATIPWLRHREAGTLDPAAVEQFLILRNGLSVLTPGRDARVVMVTSAVPGEGKTTVAIGLARAAASSGQTVILVEADFKRPAFHARLDVSDDSTGLTTALMAGADPGSLLRSPVRGMPNLLVMTSGPRPSNSAALLRSTEMGRLLDQLSADVDLVVLDAPPLLPVADGQALLDNPQLDAYLVVGRVYFTRRDEARYTRQQLDRRELSGVGLVVNGVRRLTGGDHYRGSRIGRPVSGRHRSADLGVSRDRLAPDQGVDLPYGRVHRAVHLPGRDRD